MLLRGMSFKLLIHNFVSQWVKVLYKGSDSHTNHVIDSPFSEFVDSPFSTLTCGLVTGTGFCGSTSSSSLSLSEVEAQVAEFLRIPAEYSALFLSHNHSFEK